MESTSLLLWAVLFGGIGFGFFLYGKKQKEPLPFIIGVSLFVVPYLISNVYILVLAGCGLAVLPYIFRR